MQMEEPAFSNKNHIPLVTEWYINLHQMLSLMNASKNISGSALPSERGRPAN
jgi:hypothetical protein